MVPSAPDFGGSREMAVEPYKPENQAGAARHRTQCKSLEHPRALGKHQKDEFGSLRIPLWQTLTTP